MIVALLELRLACSVDALATLETPYSYQRAL
jgi:hypothetical protein